MSRVARARTIARREDLAHLQRLAKVRRLYPDEQRRLDFLRDMQKRGKLRALLIVAALVCLGAAPAAADPGHPEPTLRLIAIYGGAAALDLGSTEWALARNPHAREGNALMRNRAVRIGANAGAVALLTVATQHAQRGGHRNRARLLKWGFVAIRVGLAVHNVRKSGGGR